MTVVFTESSLEDVLLSDESVQAILEGAGAPPPDVTRVVRRGASYFVHRADHEGSRRIVFAGGASTALSKHLSKYGEAVLERIPPFVERAKNPPLRLPHWGQYKHEDLIAFFAAGRDRLPGGPRWVAQVVGGRRDVVFWDLTTAAEFIRLEVFPIDPEIHIRISQEWADVLAEALAVPAGTDSESNSDSPDIDLHRVGFSPVTQNLSYNGWLGRITPQQRAFIEQLPDHSIRLRGPAGSGKTLALELKAIREVITARDQGVVLRSLVVTHSWALAGEIDSDLERLSELGRLDEITVLPLLAVAQLLLPAERWDSGMQLIGEDSLSGKIAQLERIEEVVKAFSTGDWLTFRSDVSPGLRSRIEANDPNEIRAFAWDCLIEFGCVLGADGIFPGVNAEARYLRLSRAPWMMPLESAWIHRPGFVMRFR